jgi:hypothetical protein
MTGLHAIALKRLVGFVFIIAALVLPVATRADTPKYATPSSEETINGVISAISGKYGLTVRNSSGELYIVTLHRGTIINPTGLQLKPGMLLVVVGHRNGVTFNADKIDAPVEAANRPAESPDGTVRRSVPVYVPSGTFQTNGPSATGGG